MASYRTSTFSSYNKLPPIPNNRSTFTSIINEKDEEAAEKDDKKEIEQREKFEEYIRRGIKELELAYAYSALLDYYTKEKLREIYNEDRDISLYMRDLSNYAGEKRDIAQAKRKIVREERGEIFKNKKIRELEKILEKVKKNKNKKSDEKNFIEKEEEHFKQHWETTDYDEPNKKLSKRINEIKSNIRAIFNSGKFDGTYYGPIVDYINSYILNDDVINDDDINDDDISLTGGRKKRTRKSHYRTRQRNTKQRNTRRKGKHSSTLRRQRKSRK